MRLLILSTGNNFTPSMLYKENYIIKAALEKEHEVIVFANQYTYVKGKECCITYTERVDGYIVRRFAYKKIINETITRKIRKVQGIEDAIVEAKPDLIFVNNAQVYNIKNLDYIKKYLPKVKIVLDFSTKYLNSARNWVSKHILHRFIYRWWIKQALPYVDKVFYISAESRDFAHEMYNIPYGLMEHNNLPGEMVPEVTKKEYRDEIRRMLGLNSNEVLLMYSGKIYPEKQVDVMLKAFNRVKNSNIRLLIIGVYSQEGDYKQEVEAMIKADSRVIFMNFVTGDELTRFVSGCDLYVQPGSISQTCQTAVCCGTPLVFNNIPTHQEIYNGNGFFADNEEELYGVISSVSNNPEQLSNMSRMSYKMAEEELDYRIIYQKILVAVGLEN